MFRPGVTLAQLVKAFVGQADVQRFKPHLGHNLLSCGVFLVKSRHFGLPLAQTTMAKLAISLSGRLGRYTNVEYLQSLYLKRRGQLMFQVRAGYNTTLLYVLPIHGDVKEMVDTSELSSWYFDSEIASVFRPNPLTLIDSFRIFVTC